jgi:cytochrome c oxidase subunit 2
MNFGEIARKRLSFLLILLAALAFSAAPQAALAQTAPQASAQSPTAANSNTPPPKAAEVSATKAAPGAAAYTPLGPEWIKGQPTPGAITFQKQYSPTGHFALWMHNYVLLPIIIGITLLVMILLLWVMVRYNRHVHPVPSKTTHNTVIEVIWTVVPVLILVAIAIPSMTLLARQYKSPPKDALTVKVTGYQWYWGYTYPDNGGFEVISHMLPDAEAIKRGEPPQLGADNRMVVPVGVPIRLQTTGADVIHSFAVPSLWFKLDAVPGRINEKELFIEKEGIYYGQCSELCGARHGFMPIVVEAVPMEQFKAFIRSQGGTLKGEAPPPPTTPAPPQQPGSAVQGAPGAGQAPGAETPKTPATGGPAAATTA